MLFCKSKTNNIKMACKLNKIMFFSGFSVTFIVSGVFGFLFLTMHQGKAMDIGGNPPECFYDADCNGQYDFCTYGYGLATCERYEDCSNCGSSVGANYRCYNQDNLNYCQVYQFERWIPCGMCYDVQNPPQNPVSCDVLADDFNNAFYVKNPSGDTQFAITDGGHLLIESGSGQVEENYEFLNQVYDPNAHNNFPIYNGNTIIALFHSDNTDQHNEYLYLAGEVHEFQINLTPPNGSFIIKNSAEMVVAYIDPNGDLYLMGCVNDNGYNFN